MAHHICHQQSSHPPYKQTSVSQQKFVLPKTSPKKVVKVPADVRSPPFYLPLQSFLSRYRVITNLGNGSFGEVTLAKINQSLNKAEEFKTFKNTLLERSDNFKDENFHNKQTGLVAIKTMTKRLSLLNDYTKVKEVNFILSIPYHKNLVQVYEMFIDDADFKLHIVMECLDQNLYQLIKARKHNHFSQQTLRSILSQILNGIRHIHHCDYFHRDIKPENILVSPSHIFYSESYRKSSFFNKRDNFVIKIADYGLARHVNNKRPYTSYVSTRWYRAPEILLRKNLYSRPVDIWAFGSVATEVATFRPLFPGANEFEQAWKVLDVLGTPMSRNGLDDYIPSYGYWDEAYYLSNQLGINFPQKKCIDISFIIPNPELSDLCEVIRECLAWNPETRADVDKICSMPYFKGTCVDTDINMSSVPITKKPTFRNQINKSESLLGIKSKTSSRQFLAPDSTICEENPISQSYLSTSSRTGVDLSFLNKSSSIKGLQLDNFDMQMVPNLTQESLESITDENFDSNSQMNLKTLEQLGNCKYNNNMNSSFENNYACEPFEQQSINSIQQQFVPSNSYQDYTYNSFEKHQLGNRDPNSAQEEHYMDWGKMEYAQDQIHEVGNGTVADDVKGFTNLQNLLANNFNSDVDENYQDERSNIFEPLYQNTIEVKGFNEDLNQRKSDDNQNSDFSNKLYSKYNLQRISKDSESLSNNSSLIDYSENFDTY